jgi:hypothetical protein
MYYFILPVILLIIFLTYNKANDEIITGFWMASDEFKKQADLDQMVFYFGAGCGYDYDGYILIATNGSIVHNDKTRFKITPAGYFKNNTYSCEMETEIDFIPKVLNMTINPQKGSMELKNGKVLYAKLFRDNITSDSTALINKKN